VDINRASVSSLKSLPGIGDAEAHRIVAGRPYLSKAELVTKKVLPEGPYLAIRRHIIAKQNPSTVQAKQKA
jgi:DNA uptake protein ComE-like DNA-binding protein